VTGIFLLLISSFAAASAQATIVLYDPLAKPPDVNHADRDEQIVKEKLLAKAKARWAEGGRCDGSSLEVIGAVDGSFTKAGVKQRAVVYEMCQTGNGFANNGIAVFENGEAVAHFAVEGGWNIGVSRVADLNQNGRDELAVETSGGMHQGYMGASLTILELMPAAARELGVFLVYTNECEVQAANKFCDRSYKLSVAPSARPVFTARKYLNRGDDEKPRWVVSGKPVTAKPIGGLSTKYESLR